METSEEHLEGMWGRGFTSDASTIHAEILIRDTKTYYNAKKNSPVFVCSFDTKKAFDCCNWHLLPETVSKFQLKVYINGETATRYKNNISNPFNLSQGVRQGSLLSPYLCNIYTADFYCINFWKFRQQQSFLPLLLQYRWIVTYILLRHS